MLSLASNSLARARMCTTHRRPLVCVRAAAADAAAAAPAKDNNKITKSALRKVVKDTTGLTMTDATKALDAVLDAIMLSVADGKEVHISGFGCFKPRQRKEHKGRNPRTGEEITIGAKTSPGFVAGKKFKDMVAGVADDE